MLEAMYAEEVSKRLNGIDYKNESPREHALRLIVEGIKPDKKDDNHWYCGNCGCRINKKDKPRYCCKCGTLIKKS